MTAIAIDTEGDHSIMNLDGNKAILMQESNLNPNTFYELRDNQMFYFGFKAKYRAKVVRIKKPTKSAHVAGGKRKTPEGTKKGKESSGGKSGTPSKHNGKKHSKHRSKKHKKREVINLLSKPNDLKNKQKLPKLKVRKTEELLEIYKTKTEEEKLEVPEDAGDTGTWKMDLGNWLS